MKLTIAIIAGFLLGYAANAVTRLLIRRRSEESYNSWYINKPTIPLIWGVLFSIFTAWQWLVSYDFLRLLHITIIVFACACISATDALIRKVPNSMLIILLINSFAFALLNTNTAKWGERLLAVIVAIFIFQIPSMFKLSVGSGDIKFAFAAAIELSLFGFLQAMIFVGIGFLISAVYLGISKKGNLKTQIPMGPYIAAGLAFTAVCPLF